jgi:hypothetical protein
MSHAARRDDEARNERPDRLDTLTTESHARGEPSVLSSPTPDQVRSLAPDPGAARSGEGLASRRHWSATGRNDRAAWGLCQGSGANPYQVTVDFGGPAFKCTCPSRKFPCKHGLGLMFLLAGDAEAFPVEAAPPSWAAEWLAARTAKAGAADTRAQVSAARPGGAIPGADGETAAADSEAAAADAEAAAAQAEAGREKRIKAREKKVDAGLADLDRWLADLVRRGLLAARGEGYAFWDQAGARLVDAQAASLGREVRGIGAAASRGAGWAEGTLERVARIHLIGEAYRRQDTLPADLRADVRALVGWTIKEEELATADAVPDRWLAVGRTVTSDDRLTTTRTWLLGEATRRFALHLAFGAGGANPVPIAMAGSSFRGALRFYPSAVPLRAIVDDGPLDPGGAIDRLPSGLAIDEAAAAFAAILARNPFVTVWPTVLGDVTPVGRDGTLLVRDAVGAAVRVTPAAIAARLLALAGGRPVTVFGLWSGRSIRVLSALSEGRLIDLGVDTAGDEGDLAVEPVPARGVGAAGSAPDGGGSNGAPETTGHDGWGRLISSALLGTERSEPPAVALSPVVAAVSEQPAESRLLATAAIVAATRRAGWLPQPDPGPLPEPAPPDPRPAVGVAAAWILRRALDDQPELVPEWLGLACAAGRRPPDDELPRLLNLAARQRETRDALAPLLGPRAHWLVEQMPELARGLPAPRDVDSAQAWSDATTAAARAAVVADLRDRDPVAGRLFLEETWDQATTDERALGVAALRTGLSPADEALLSRAWRDSRSEVRLAAIDLLARLPDSELAVLSAATARPMLALAGRLRPTLQIHPPAAWSDDLARLGVPRKPPQGTGERAWWLRHVVARVDPASWERWLDADPKTLIDRGRTSDESAALLLGWLEAADRHADARWSAALLGDTELLGREDVQGFGPFRLLAHLPPDERDATAARIIAAADGEIARHVAENCPPPWSPLLSRAVLTALARQSADSGMTVGMWFLELVRLAVRRMPTEHAEQLETIVTGDGDRLRMYPIFVQFLDLLDRRKRMSTAFVAEEVAR